MIRPDFKSYREGHRGPIFNHLINRGYLLGRNPQDARWIKKRPSVNISQNGQLFTMEIFMPGFKKEELEIMVSDDILTVRGEKQKEAQPDSEYILKEFDVEMYERRFKLAKGVGHEQINARYDHGILKLVFTDVPTEEERSHKLVEII